MRIRAKILLIVLPLLSVAIIIVGVSSYLQASSAVNQLAVEFLNFMGVQVQNYADGQWNLLVENNLAGNVFMEDAAKTAVENYAQSILRSNSESIFALDGAGNVSLRAGPAFPTPEESQALLAYDGRSEFITIQVDGKSRAAYTLPFTPFGWQIFISEDRGFFYGTVENIFIFSALILAGALAAAFLLLFIMARYLTRPIEDVVRIMKNIILSNNLEETVPVYYKDEIGQLSHTFNRMLRALGAAYNQIKQYAFDAVVARKRETKIRNVFQLYVPKNVIEEVFDNPEKMLVGNNQDCAILFSDIRSFTTISESMSPDDLVISLNRYFSIMVNIIMDRGGVVDKYIGDAIMAIYGAPVHGKNDALASVISGLEMIKALEGFNTGQKNLNGPEFRIGVGVHYGVVTVGNIGCEKKMNYTVIGDSVNLASRLEGLTKKYKEPILFSEGVFEQVSGHLPCRVVDKVAVKGKTQGVPILTARLELSPVENEAWKIHGDAVGLYYKRDFSAALPSFEKILGLLPGDPAASRFAERCRIYIKTPPPSDWDGVEIMTEK